MPTKTPVDNPPIIPTHHSKLDHLKGIRRARTMLRLDEALARCESALKLFPQDLDLLVAKADTFILSGMFSEADQVGRRLVEAFKDSAEAWYTRGVGRFFMGADAEALEALAKARELSPTLYQAAKFEADVLIRMGRTVEAAEILDQQIAWYRDDLLMEDHLAFIYVTRGDLYLAAGQHQQARALICSALQVYFGNALLLDALARMNAPLSRNTKVFKLSHTKGDDSGDVTFHAEVAADTPEAARTLFSELSAVEPDAARCTVAPGSEVRGMYYERTGVIAIRRFSSCNITTGTLTEWNLARKVLQ